MKEWNAQKIVELMEHSGGIAMKYKSAMEPEIKSDKTIVTKADKTIETFLDAELCGNDPGVYVIGEESLDSHDWDYVGNALSETAFIIDPVDGTAVYAAGLSMWGISVGYAVGGVLRESAIYLPETGEMMITDHGKTLLRGEKNGQFRELKPFRKAYESTGAVSCTQNLVKHGSFSGGELLQSIGSCVYPGVYLARQIYMAGIFHAKLWDIAGFLPALKNLGFRSLTKSGTDYLSLKITPELYEMGPEAKIPFKMPGHCIIASTDEICTTLAEKCSFPENRPFQ